MSERNESFFFQNLAPILSEESFTSGVHQWAGVWMPQGYTSAYEFALIAAILRNDESLADLLIPSAYVDDVPVALHKLPGWLGIVGSSLLRSSISDEDAAMGKTGVAAYGGNGSTTRVLVCAVADAPGNAWPSAMQLFRRVLTDDAQREA